MSKHAAHHTRGSRVAVQSVSLVLVLLAFILYGHDATAHSLNRGSTVGRSLSTGRGLSVGRGVSPQRMAGSDKALAPSIAPNDDYRSALLISSTPYTYTEDTTGATTEPADPYLPCIYSEGYHSVWFEIDIQTPGTLTVDTFNSGYDTALAFWEGSYWQAGPNIACNDDANNTKQSLATVQVSGYNTTVMIEVVGLSSLEEGTLKLHAQFVPNAPSSFSKFSPSNGYIDQPTSMGLGWQYNPDATSYEYCINKSASCAGAWTDNGLSTSAYVYGLDSGTTYYWQVRARNGGGTTEADGGTWWRFSTLSVVGGRATGAGQVPIPGVTISLSTASGQLRSVMGVNPNGTFTFTNVMSGSYVLTPTKAGYTFTPARRVFTVPPDAVAQDFTGAMVAPGSIVMRGPAVGQVGATQRFTATVSPGTTALPITYTWQASGGLAPVQHAGVNGVSDTVTFSWASSGPQRVTIWVGNPAATITSSLDISITPRYAFIPLVRLPPPPPPPVPAAPTLNPIAAPGAGLSYAVSWSAPSGATSYLLQEATNASFTGATTAYSGASTNTSIPSRGIATYYYRVRAHNTSGDSPWSSPQSVPVYWELEPNDLTAQASGALVSGQNYYGRLSTGDSDDFFYFDTPSAGSANLTLTLPPSLVGHAAIWIGQADALGNFINPCGIGGVNVSPASKTCTLATAGRYYVRLYADQADDVNPYTLRVTYP